MLVVFTATDHLCFIRAGSAIVGPLLGSQRALYPGRLWAGTLAQWDGELTGVLWFDAD